MVYFGDYLSKKKTILVVNSAKSDRWKSIKRECRSFELFELIGRLWSNVAAA